MKYNIKIKFLASFYFENVPLRKFKITYAALYFSWTLLFQTEAIAHSESLEKSKVYQEAASHLTRTQERQEISPEGSVEARPLKGPVSHDKDFEVYLEGIVELFNEFTHRKIF